MTYVDVVIQSDKFGTWAYRTNVDVKCRTKREELDELKKAFWASVRNAYEHLIDMHTDLKECDEPKLPIPEYDYEIQNEPTKKQIRFVRDAYKHLIDTHTDGALKDDDEPKLPVPPSDCGIQNEPTEKQIRFAKAISDRLGIPLPEVKTRQSLFIFIRDNRKKFDDMGAEMRTDPYDMEDEGWDYQEGLDYGDVSGADPWGVDA